MPDRLIASLTDYATDVRTVARIPAPLRARVARVSVVLEQMTAFVYDDHEDEETELAELLDAVEERSLEGRAALTMLEDLRRILEGETVIEERSPELRREAGLRDLLDRIVGALA